jgi:hypothetical protein
MNSRTTATKSSSGNNSTMRRNSIATASCLGVSVVLHLCGRYDKS